VWSSLNEWVLGYPDQALRYTVDAFSLARRLNKPVDLANAGSIASHIYCHHGDFERAVQVAKETVRLSNASGFRLWKALGEIRGAWAGAHMGEAVDAVARIRAGLAELDAVNFYLGRPLYECLLSEVLALTGATDDALTNVERALQAYPDEVLYRPYALWVRGRVRLKIDPRSNANRAEADFREAIAIAQTISAKSWELRATTSLSRLLVKQGKRDAARTMLVEIYNWFTEGFDTAILKDAKALLAELSE
jgi:predicted ATPase